MFKTDNAFAFHPKKNRANFWIESGEGVHDNCDFFLAFLVYHFACKWHKSVFNYIIVALYIYLMIVIPYYCEGMRLSRNTGKLESVFILNLT